MITKLDYLQRMGIEVWLPRDAADAAKNALAETNDHSVAEAASAGETDLAALRSRQQPAKTPAPESSTPSAPAATTSGPRKPPRFCLFFLDYGELGICGALTVDGSFDQPMRRFCDDVAQSILGKVPGKATLLEVRWPLVESSAISQSIEDARELVTASLARLPPRRLILGDEFARIAHGVEDTESVESGELPVGTIVVPADVGAHLNNPARKRELWGRIREANLYRG
ncbi:MAG: hypothetical protein O2780_08705 [Proteobacteria bacterium]|nr:hypothetical protein [Pseudomonadota bacterium]MDA1300841.1 hypothetical protein [Pseudomonadota bacterium]